MNVKIVNISGRMDIKHCCCFTGHRPEKLHVAEDVVLQRLDLAIATALQDGYTTFISGMAKGVDIWAAELVLERRRLSPNIRLVCAVPYEGFGRNWKDGWTERYDKIIHMADAVEYICTKSSRSTYQRRNEWMVNRAALLIAAYTGESGGTRNTIRYAERIDRMIYYLQLSN